MQRQQALHHPAPLLPTYFISHRALPSEGSDLVQGSVLRAVLNLRPGMKQEAKHAGNSSIASRNSSTNGDSGDVGNSKATEDKRVTPGGAGGTRSALVRVPVNGQ